MSAVATHSLQAPLGAIGARIVRRLATRIAKSSGNCTPATDLVWVGMLTMFDAVRRHDPQRGELLPYVCTRLRWAMMSEARRGVRRVRLLSGGHRAEPRDPTFDEREHDAAYDEDYADSFEAPAPESNNPEEAVALKQATVRLTEALGKLPRRTRLVLVRHYFGGERFDHVARDLKISKTSVCRLHDMGKRMLREHISKTDRARAPRRPRS